MAKELAKQYDPSYFGGQPDISWIRLNPVKDDTDTESAIRKAIAYVAVRMNRLS